MYSAWTKHLKDPEERKKFIDSVYHSRWLLDHIKILTSQMESDIEKSEISPRIYDSPNWEFRQAHINGYKQCLKMVNTLLDLDQKETNDREFIKS